MAKKDDIEDILGGKTPAKKAAADKPAAKKAAADKPAAKKAAADKPADKPAAKKAATKKEPVVFAEGEQDEIIKKAKKIVAKGEINSRDLAAKLDIKTRKLRPCLYMMQRAGEVTLTPGPSRVLGMTVAPV